MKAVRRLTKILYPIPPALTVVGALAFVGGHWIGMIDVQSFGFFLALTGLSVMWVANHW